MKTQKFIVEIEMPDGDSIGAGWLQDLIQNDCDIEDTGRQKVTLKEIPEGADVIEMPSEEEISIECEYSAHKMDIDDGETPNSGLYWRGWGDAIRWFKSKIVK